MDGAWPLIQKKVAQMLYILFLTVDLYLIIKKTKINQINEMVQCKTEVKIKVARENLNDGKYTIASSMKPEPLSQS